MAKKKPISALQAEYNKNRKRIQNAVRRLEKQGYIIPDKILPDRPKRITKGSVRRLQKITPEEIRKKSQYLDVETGELKPGQKEAQRLRKERAKRAAETRKRNKEAERRFWENQQVQVKAQEKKKEKEDYANMTNVIIHNYLTYLAKFPKTVWQIVRKALDEAIAKDGKDAVAKRLQERAESLSDFLNKSAIFGDSIAAIVAYCAAQFGDLPGMTEEYGTDIMDELDKLDQFYAV